MSGVNENVSQNERWEYSTLIKSWLSRVWQQNER